MRIHFTPIVFGLLIFHSSCFSQNSKLDSLTRKFHDPSLNDTTKVWVLLGIAQEIFSPEGRNSNNVLILDSAMLVLNQALVLSKKNNFTKGIAWTYNLLGQAYRDKGQRNQALNYLLVGLQFSEKSGDKFMSAVFHNEIGNIYSSFQREIYSDRIFHQALDHYKHSLKLALALNSKEGLSIVAMLQPNIGRVFSANKNYDSALFYYQRGIDLAKNSEDEVGIKFNLLVKLCHLYEEQDNSNRALQLGRQALSLALENQGRHFLEDTYPVLANIHLDLNNYDSANYFINQTIHSGEIGANNALSLLASYYFKKGDYNKAILYAQKSIDKWKDISPLSSQSIDFYNFLSDSYAKLGNYRKAHEYDRLRSTLMDSLNKENMAAQVIGLQTDYDAAKQIDAIDLLEKEVKINSLTLQRNRIIEYLIAGILLLALVIIGIVVNQYRLVRRSKREQERIFLELDTLKSHFFANISHEFRTPLTLLLGPLEKRLSHATEANDKKELTIMHRNATRLLTLVNQLLDLSRLEAGTLKLKGHSQSLPEFISFIASQFSSMADSKSITFKLQIDEPVALFFDPDKLEKIITNLLSNAFKFTPSGGHITLTLTPHGPTQRFKNGYAEITVADSGSGIEAQHLGKIFDRFYQADTSTKRIYEGSGIGLALTQELVKLHEGSITVTSTPRKGSCFTVQLPLGTDHLNASDMVYTEAKVYPTSLTSEPVEVMEHEHETEESSHPRVLIVEDNADLRFYLHNSLKEFYDIHEGADGEQGLIAALEIIPDLIISDLMMPKMDGLHLCEKLKSNEKTSHIPIILLTAKVDIETKLEGLHTGADDYMAKPFDARELQARIHNLIESRSKLQLKFSQQFNPSASEIKVESMENRFLKKVKNTIEAHMGDSTFGVESLAKEVAMSTVQLYRKLKALTGYTPNELIRNMRIDRAASLLRQHAGNVSEVAFDVGFNNLSYFAKCFKEKFNMLPSEFFNARD